MTRSRTKPEITNFRVRWDKIADLAVQTAVCVFSLWLMVFVTMAYLSNF